MAESGNVYRLAVITSTSVNESLVSETPWSLNEMSSQYACQAMVEYTLKLNRSLKQIVHNFHIDLEILWKKKCMAQGWPRWIIRHSSLSRTDVRKEYLHMFYTIDFCD